LIPEIQNCVVCDFVRPELNGKVIVLGFFGVCPNVDVSVPQLDQPTALTFLFTGSPGSGTYLLTFDVVDESQRRVVASTAGGSFDAAPDARTVLAPTLLLVFGHPGTFVIRCLVDQAERYRSTFNVSQAPSAPA
jgi:hypothetical protein